MHGSLCLAEAGQSRVFEAVRKLREAVYAEPQCSPVLSRHAASSCAHSDRLH